MEYLNRESIKTAPSAAVRKQGPYPWTNLLEPVTAKAFECLRETLPDVPLSDRKVGIKRADGQCSHDRAILNYSCDMKLQLSWKGFATELGWKSYQSFLHHKFGLCVGRLMFGTIRCFSIRAANSVPAY